MFPKLFAIYYHQSPLVGIVSRHSGVRVDSRANAHRHHFLEEQFASVRDFDLANGGGFVLARWSAALVSHLLQMDLCRQTAALANVDSVLIRIAEESIADKVRTAVGDQAITFHLSHAQPSVPGTTFQGLSRQHGNWTACSGVYLVVDQVLQTLVKRGTEKYSRAHRPSRVTLEQVLVSELLVPHNVETRADFFHSDIREGSCIPFASLEDNYLPQQTLDELGDGHTRRNGVWVDNNVGNHALNGEGHVFLAIGHTDCTLLTVAGRKFIPDLWNTDVADSDLGEAITFLGGTNEYIIHNPVFVCLHRGTAITLCEPGGHDGTGIQRCCFPNQDIVSRNSGAGCYKTIVVQFAVVSVFHATSLVVGWLFEDLGVQGSHGAHGARLFLVDVASVVGTSEETPVDCRLVHNERIFLVVTGVNHNGNTAIDPTRQLAEVQKLHGTCGTEWFLRVVQHVGHGIHADLVVRRIDSHGLLTHGTLIGVTRRLVVVRERNDGGTDSQNHGGMDLTVGVGRRIGLIRIEIPRIHRHHCGFFLFRVDVFDDSLHE
mmetsp:Transcript_9533/g.28432  ORF Transcript_9533/g.28432 Transcript_9533/m.28432 type:complete len:545 (-) Transcript_9533:2521-4155(-)